MVPPAAAQPNIQVNATPTTARRKNAKEGAPDAARQKIHAVPLGMHRDAAPRAIQLGVVGLGRMGASIVRRLVKRDLECVVFDTEPAAVAALRSDGAIGSASLHELVQAISKPRSIWLMLPAGVVDGTLAELAPLLDAGDVVIDGGNSHYRDATRRAAQLGEHGIHFLDVGTSGGVAGLERGFCLMIGGEPEIVQHMLPVFAVLAPGVASAPRTPGRAASLSGAEEGFLHCGPHGAGHFVKMIHNGIEYGVMAAYAEGLDILRHANVGMQARAHDAETAPLRHPEFYQYAMNLADITEVWRRGSVISSWLLDLTAAALCADPELTTFTGRVSDSGEGRWAVHAAIDEGVPVNVLSAALYERFTSRGAADFGHRVLSAMRHEFGGHAEQEAK